VLTGPGYGVAAVLMVLFTVKTASAAAGRSGWALSQPAISVRRLPSQVAVGRPAG
jgi:hypothetical protein